MNLSLLINEYKKLHKSIIKDNILICPSFVDVHVHFREPGYSYKETILSGSLSAAKGGYTCVCPMPNLKPCPDSFNNLKVELDLIKKANLINVVPYGTLTINQDGKVVSKMDELIDYVVAFSDDGKGVTDKDIMKECMLKAKTLNKVVVCHCEDKSLIKPNASIHDGEYAKEHSHIGISKESEYEEIRKDLILVRETKCKYHVCHISTKESVELIRKAKLEGLDVTCETAPHYLLLNDSMLQESGDFKMNPPIRSKEDQRALIKGLIDGTIDMIATDHAPHSVEEKNKGLDNSLFGVVGLETAFPLLYTYLVKNNIVSLDKLLDLMIYAPRKRFNLPLEKDSFTIFDLNDEYKINPNEFLSKGRSTPFKGYKVFGKCLLTVYKSKIVYKDKEVNL